jgi:hypothetical protein
MQVLINSFLGIAKRVNSSINIRYSERRRHTMRTPGNGKDGKELKTAMQQGENIKRISTVVIRQSYTYLEPFVRSTFEGAEDIRIIVDRRFHERRQVTAPWVPNRRTSGERRLSAPMLDIIIAMED